MISVYAAVAINARHHYRHGTCDRFGLNAAAYRALNESWHTHTHKVVYT